MRRTCIALGPSSVSVCESMSEARASPMRTMTTEPGPPLVLLVVEVKLMRAPAWVTLVVLDPPAAPRAVPRLEPLLPLPPLRPPLPAQRQMDHMRASLTCAAASNIAGPALA